MTAPTTACLCECHDGGDHQHPGHPCPTAPPMNRLDADTAQRFSSIPQFVRALLDGDRSKGRDTAVVEMDREGRGILWWPVAVGGAR